ncbi:C-type lectin domain family 2 member D-like isoform X1 [Alligator sinensis]|uniref:C-type lectin domain family 2 member D-like isoform X1 n=1 Tax=Alligator sinensis TaxID=38654 RepID=A0A1U8DP43_ALLSI|nr:C-type lectin domain family 2 member D-like isoform X1 [Alligator sinensis]XP_014379493.1 C-type lectin domain family 2 member D-like isoform X1 [Alligator sinensis]XP_014379494.1 C-type lectin domain family 2 member D-like isoform X1 [Alligator sinensis]XP_025069762.1 C-type lectin domain family 2 member D-like isoform X1 [Alligator sinensis]
MAEDRGQAETDTNVEAEESILPSPETAEDKRRDANSSLKYIKEKWVPIAVSLTITILLIIIIALVARKSPPCPSCTAACPDNWPGYQGKCFLFSDTEESWNSSQSNCSSHGASLAVIDSLDDLIFMLRHKGTPYYWIGLWKETKHRWRWTNGTIFNGLFPIRGEGDCAYVNDDGVSSSRCSSKRNFICSQPDNCARGKPSTLMEDTAPYVM